LAIDRAAEYARDATKKIPPVSAKTTGYGIPGVPVDTGRMRQSIQKRKLSLLAAEVYAGTNYSKFVHDGTSKKPPQPFFEDMLTQFGGKEAIAGIVQSTLQKLFG
jgi:HK97 gp10 family phage protein